MRDAPVPIAIAVVQHDGLFLVGRRQSGQVLAGMHEFPGGKIKPGETNEQAATRECLEETGIEVRVVKHLMSHVHSYEHGAVKLAFFLCRPNGAPADPKLPFQWLTREQLNACEFPAGNSPLIDALARGALKIAGQAE